MKIEHVAIWARDVERLRTFYQEYFDARASDKYVNSEKSFASYFLSFDDGARLELMQMPTVPASADDAYAQATGLIHIAISVGSEDAVDRLSARLAADGFELLDGPRRTGDGYYESVVMDPENNRIEITV